MTRTEIRLVGFGGQGILLAGRILARSTAIYEKREVAQTESYGSEARGGMCKSDIILSDEEIDHPDIIEADILIAMSQEALNKYIDQLKPEGLLIIDPAFIKKTVEGGRKVYEVPATQIATSELQRPLVANMIMIGSLIGLTGLVSKEAIRASVMDSVPKGTEEPNLKALERGIEIGAKLASSYR